MRSPPFGVSGFISGVLGVAIFSSHGHRPISDTKINSLVFVSSLSFVGLSYYPQCTSQFPSATDARTHAGLLKVK